MKLIKELRKDSDMAKCGKFKVRRAARTILVNDKGEVALMNVTKGNYYKIPGGGIEYSEDIIEAVHREAREEAGCEIKIVDELGMIIEYRPLQELLQISYCYVSKVTKAGAPSFTDEEIADGYGLEWHSLDDALALMRKTQSKKDPYYNGAARDYEFMMEYCKSVRGMV